MVVSTYQAVSGGGLAGTAELDEQVRKVADGAAALALDGAAVEFPEPSKFPEPIAFNVIPQAGSFVDDGRRDRRGAEAPQREPQDPRAPRPAVSVPCVRVPVFAGHSLSINAGSSGRSPRAGARGAAAAPRRRAGRRADAARGRRRRRHPRRSLPRRPHRRRRRGLALFVSGDNLRKGAALNAVQIAEALADAGATPGWQAQGVAPQRGSRRRSGPPRRPGERPSCSASDASQASTSPSSWSWSSASPLRTAWASSPSSSVSQATVAGTPRARSRSP